MKGVELSQGKTGTYRSLAHVAPRPTGPYPENSDIRLGPELPTLSDTPKAVTQQTPETFSTPGTREGRLLPLPQPPPLNRGPTTPGSRHEQGATHEGRGPGPGPMEPRTGTGAEGHLPTLEHCWGGRFARRLRRRGPGSRLSARGAST